MLSGDKQTRLAGFLGELPPEIAARLAQAVEADRVTGGSTLPHETILAALRPKLEKSSSAPSQARAETPENLFRAPFADLLTGERRKPKRMGRIARASAERAWAWLTEELMPERHAELSAEMAAAISEGNLRRIDAALAALWQDAAAALKTALAGDATALGSEEAVADIKEIALLLHHAQEIAKLQKRIPKDAHAEGIIGIVRDAFYRFSRVSPELAPYVTLIAMGRLKHSWEALRVALEVARKPGDGVTRAEDLGAAGEVLMDDLDAYAKRIQSVRPLKFDLRTLLADLEAFSRLSGGIVREIDLRRDDGWEQRLDKNRAAVARAMETLIERAPKEIFAGLPAVKAGVFSKGPKPLDTSRAPDPERVKLARAYAQLLSQTRPLAEAAAFKAKLDEVHSETATMLQSYNEDILRELRAAPPGTRAIVEQHFATALDICTWILGAEEAEFLRRRGRVPAG
jgi:hypothetical protein